MLEYIPILMMLLICLIVSGLVLALSLILSPRRPYASKLSAYECGFEQFSDSRGRFDVRFYLLGLLFIVFDLEIAFLFPWVVSLQDIGLVGFFSMMFFLLVLTVGFVYEWRKKALEWD